MKWYVTAGQVALKIIDRLLGRERRFIPVPDLDDMRENEIKRSIRIEKDIVELEKLQQEKAAREADQTIR